MDPDDRVVQSVRSRVVVGLTSTVASRRTIAERSSDSDDLFLFESDSRVSLAFMPMRSAAS